MFEWFKRRNNPVQQVVKESQTGRVIFTGNRASWNLGGNGQSAEKFAREGYQLNVVAYQAINKTADAVAAIPWIAKRPNGDELSDSPMLALINRPNPMQSRTEFIRALVGFYRIAGNAYIERVMVSGRPRELYTLRPDRMKVIPSATGMPAGYVYKVAEQKVQWDADPRTGVSDIRHMKTFNPLDDWYGMSPLLAGAYAIDQHSESMTHIQALLQNGAAPSGAMEVESELSDDQFNRLKAEIDEKYSGSRNAGRPMLLEGGMKWTQMGLSPTDMGIIETKYSSARDISLALGVPPLLLNIPGDSTYSNYKEARLAFYEETVIPLAFSIRDELNQWLSPIFGGTELDIDLDQIPAIAEKRLDLWTMADQATDLTINEKRALKGYEEIAGGDDVLINVGLIPLSYQSLPMEDESGQSIQLSAGNLDYLKAIAYGETKDSYSPPQGVREAARKGLEYRDEYGRGGTEVGIARARDLSNGRSVSLETIRRMVSFFARHEENRVPPSEKTEPDGGPTNGWIAWQLWGGDAGRSWANKISAQEDDA